MPASNRRKALREFLVEHFPDEGSLKRFVRDSFEKVGPLINWDTHLENQADDFIEALSAKGLLPELWPALRAEFDRFVPTIDQLEALWKEGGSTPAAPFAPARPNLALQLYRTARANTVPGARVVLTEVFSGIELKGQTDAKGFARFLHSGDVPATYWPVIELEQPLPPRRAALGSIRIAALPYDEAIDLDSLHDQSWEKLSTPVKPSESLVDRVTTGRGIEDELGKLPRLHMPDLTGAWGGTEASLPAAPAAQPAPLPDARPDVPPAGGPYKDVASQPRPESLEHHWPWGTPAAEVVVSHESYVVGFNPAWKLARWVAYKVEPGATDWRRALSPWKPDPLIPPAYQTSASAYSRSPYDRGQLVRRADISTPESAFYLSVVVPQTPRLNRAAWLAIENLSSQAGKNQDVWVIAGPVFLPGREGGQEVVRFQERFLVPTHFFRIMLRKPPAGGALEVLAFLVPNELTLREDATLYLTSVAKIEEVTHLRFFTRAGVGALPPPTDVATALWS